MYFTTALIFTLLSKTISANPLATANPAPAPDGVFDLPDGRKIAYAGAEPTLVSRDLVSRADSAVVCHANNPYRSLKGASASGTAFCSSYLSIGTSTSVIATTTPTS